VNLKHTDRLWLSGNEAVAMGAWEAGVQVASGYPGTPSTEILENLCSYEGVYTEWAPNEKVALEVAIGASFAGVRALATMKHVGLNVASDPLFTASYTGVRGGLVVITADDPEMHSSQNEQDNRNYAFAAKLPMFEPSDPAEAREMLSRAFEVSERFDTPVLYRITTRIAHVKGVVKKGRRTEVAEPSIEKVPGKFVMLPGPARARRSVIEQRMADLRDWPKPWRKTGLNPGCRPGDLLRPALPTIMSRRRFRRRPSSSWEWSGPCPGKRSGILPPGWMN
jgi:indolepyruvate ferredoxin oxidoreductase, alpha subunit